MKKKKIKDLSLVEANKYCTSRVCDNCPFRNTKDNCLLDYIAGYHIEPIFREVLDTEVEINE